MPGLCKAATERNEATLKNMKSMKSRFKSAIRAACHAFAGVVCVGLVILASSTAQAQILFTSDGTSHIYKYTPSGSKSTFASGLVSPLGLAFDSAGNLYVGGGEIYKFTPSGTKSVFATNDVSAQGLAFDSAGNLYVASGNLNIYKFTPSGSESLFVNGMNNGFSQPQGLAFDRSNNLYVADGESDEIFKVTPSGSVSYFAGATNASIINLTGLAFDSSGNLYVADNSAGVVYKFIPSGSETVFATFGGSSYPYGLAFDSAGNLYVSTALNTNNFIYEFSLSGSKSTFAPGVGLGDYGYLAIAPANSWTDGSGKWETATNWSLGSAPSLYDSADYITNANSKTITIDAATTNTPSALTIYNLIVSAPLGSTNTLSLPNAGAATPLQVLASLTIGNGGALSVSNSALVAGSVTNAGLIQANAGTLTFLGGSTAGTLTGSLVATNGGAFVLSGTNYWTIQTAVAYGGGASGGSIISSNAGTATSVFLLNPVFCNNNGALMVVGGNDINYGQIGSDLTNTYVITGNGSLTGNYGNNSYGIFNQGTIASVAGGTLILDPRDAYDFGGVQNALNGTMIVASNSTLVIRRTAHAWTDLQFGVFPANSGTMLMQGGTLAGASTNTVTGTNGIATFYINNSTGLIEGCGTFANFATVLNNGTIQANCGGSGNLNFTGIVTNNGNIVAANGTFINLYGPVVNSGAINATNGSVEYFSTLQNNGSISGDVFGTGTNSWTSPNNGKWEVSTNWSTGTPNIVQPWLYITNANSKTVTFDTTTTNTPSALTISNLTVSAPLGSTNTLFLNNAGTATVSLTVINTLLIDSDGAMVVNNSAVQEILANGAEVGGVGGNAALTITNGGEVYSAYGIIGFQGSSSNNTALVTSTGSVWSIGNEMYVGSDGSSNTLTISNGGVVSCFSGGVLGGGSFSSNNTVVVTGNGSVWNNESEYLYIGEAGAGNQMIISSGGAVYDYSGEVGVFSGSNSVLITGTSSLWSNSSSLFVGDTGAGNQMIISSGGAVYNVSGYVGDTASSGNNSVLVTGTGSVWSNSSLVVGVFGSGNQMIISNGGAVYDGIGHVGSSGYNTVLVTGSGSVWQNSVELGLGTGGSSNSLTVANSGEVLALNLVVGSSASSSSNLLTISGGSVIVNGALVVGQSGQGSLLLSNGTVTVDSLIASNGANSGIQFSAGTLISSGTSVTNTQLFVVGDGTDAATFELNGGVHSFANNLEIRSNAFLTGCGTVSGNVVVDPGGTVLADCGTLTFTGIVTNYGTMRAIEGTTLAANGAVVNYGTIDAINGATNFHGGLINNNGTVLTAGSVIIRQVGKSGQDMVIKIPSVSGHTYQLQFTTSLTPANWTSTGASQPGSNGTVLMFIDSGGATNLPSRFYRVECTAP
jgi:T5SS/PEP-CTERM-associated repeat protein